MLTHRGIDVDTTYYAGEIIVEPTFQGQRSCSLLISHFMEAVREMKFSHMLWVSSLRGQEHPLCPSNYVEPTSIWRKIGGHKTDITLSIKWPTYQVDGSIKEESNPIVCWMKEMSL